ncbi:FAD/NAD(P)-binding domain-containing protein [Sistotremastrum niveocremeum HHB9708]|uniref:FAD/NAD(P)-binding domain-containing protein n=1 Tax=Sistotremastrum niveocremeum HHB9708 TaxID=1314777 RepID=A0A164RJM5_9AGAM|nr:FAD/NAD(P)-binding domain-containing protein [Sistotremastrum niveocremeum HHB9708]
MCADSGQLKVIIVGAGLAGLTAALAFRRAGHIVSIYEKYPEDKFGKEIGAAISLTPNSTRILDGFGVEFERMGCVEHRQRRYFKHDEEVGGAYKVDVTGSHLRDTYGYPFYMVHRTDLLNELRQLVTQPTSEGDGLGEACELYLGRRVVECHPEDGVVVLKGGERVEGDIIVGADGINSSLRKFILGKEINLIHSGSAAYRTTIPYDQLTENPKLKWLTDNPHGMIFIRDERRSLVVYPCRGGKVISIGGIHPVDPTSSSESSEPPTKPSTADFLQAFEDYAPRFKELISLSPNVHLWPLLISPSSSVSDSDDIHSNTYVNGRTVMIGDAAHAMLPHIGQGGAQGIEDAALLPVLFPLNTSNSYDIVSSRLKLYERLRKPRVERIMELSNRTGKGFVVVDGELERWLYGYDVVKEGKQALAEYLRNGGK